MLIAWGDIFLMAGVTGVITYVATILYSFWKKELNLAYSTGLGLFAAIGFVCWFTIFNFFSLSSLNHDLPISFFPVSPEDISCAVTVSMVVMVYNWLVARPSIKLKWQQPKLIVSALAVIVALIVDVYFI